MASKASARASGYRCTECGWSTVKWVGRCGECQAWGSLSEIGAVTVRTTAATTVARPALPIGEVDARRAAARSTGVGEFDRVLGGGLVPGAVVLVAGEPGIGKSTLLLDVAARAARRRGTHRALRDRRGVGRPGAAAGRAHRGDGQAPSTSPPRPTSPPCSARSRPSARTCWSSTPCRPSPAREVEGAAGNVSQVREVAASPDPGRQGPRHRHPPGRPRHQGRLHRRPPGARAPRRRRGAVRGRPALPAAPGARGQEPLRPHRRGRLLRPLRRRHRRPAPTRAGSSSPTARHRRRAPASRSPSRAAAPRHRGAGPGRTQRDPAPAPGHAAASTRHAWR